MVNMKLKWHHKHESDLKTCEGDTLKWSCVHHETKNLYYLKHFIACDVTAMKAISYVTVYWYEPFHNV